MKAQIEVPYQCSRSRMACRSNSTASLPTSALFHFWLCILSAFYFPFANSFHFLAAENNASAASIGSNFQTKLKLHVDGQLLNFQLWNMHNLKVRKMLLLLLLGINFTAHSHL
jgi:hypothetical protein